MKKLIYATTLGLFALTANAQINWQKGGNAQIPVAAPPTLGTDITWNSPLNFVTRGVQRMTILGGLPGGLTTGFVGIGTSFINPQSLLHISAFNNNTGNVFRTDGNFNLDQNWQMFSGPTSAGVLEKFRVSNPLLTDDVGLYLVQTGNMSFFTGGFTAGAAGSNQRMMIHGTAATIPGMVQVFENNATINSNTTYNF